eukprot:gene21826-28853_t
MTSPCSDRNFKEEAGGKVPSESIRGAYNPRNKLDAPSNSATDGSKSQRRRSGSRPPKDRYGKMTGTDIRRYKNKPSSTVPMTFSDTLAQNWLVDSGATAHATSEINNHVQELDEPLVQD